MLSSDFDLIRKAEVRVFADEKKKGACRKYSFERVKIEEGEEMDKKKRIKRQQVEAGDGWTIITRGNRGISKPINNKAESRFSTTNDNDRHGQNNEQQLPTQIVENLTPEKLLSDFKALQDRWNDTALARQVEEIIKKRTWRVRNAVCIGIGSFSRDWAHRWRSLWQLVLFVGVVRYLQDGYGKQNEKQKELKQDEGEGGEAVEEKERKEDHEMHIYAQDPAFTPLDITFLSHLDISVLPSGIETYISASTFVYSPFVDWFLLLPAFLQPCLETSSSSNENCSDSSKSNTGPELHIGNEILPDYTLYAQTEEKKEKLAECNALGKAFLGKREVVRLREFDLHAQALSGMVVYCVRDVKQGEGE